MSPIGKIAALITLTVLLAGSASTALACGGDKGHSGDGKAPAEEPAI